MDATKGAQASTGSDPIGERDEGVEGLFRAEFDPMFRLAFTVVKSAATAEEVVQEAFVEVARRWSTLEKPGGYLRTCVVNGCRRRLNRQQTRDRAETRLTAEQRGRGDGDTPYLLDVVDALPARQRLAVVLTYYADMSSAEAAKAMDCRPATVRSLVRKALHRLREEISP